MHTKGRFRNVLFDSSLHPGSAALAILVMLLFLIFLLLFMTFAAQPVQGQSSARAQNPVPPTARQAAAMPQFASRLSRHVPPEAAGKRRAAAPACSRDASPQDGVIYENGPVNGTTDAWTINFGYVVSDSFTVSGNSTVGGFDLYTWEFPGDVMTSVDWSITSAENGGTVYGSGTAPVTDQFISTNQFGYDIDKISVTGLNVGTGSGTVWLNLQNASVPSGDLVYWDENSGIGCHSQGCPSLASESAVGTIPSEAFDITSGPPAPACFKADGVLQIIHDFGAGPAGVTIDKAGNLYGVSGGGDYGAGMVYRMAPKQGSWLFTSLYSFLGDDSGSGPSPVIVGPDGALYGAANGGIKNCGKDGGSYCGLIFRLRPPPSACATISCPWKEEVLYRFTGTTDGSGPNTLSFDSSGNLYGISSGVIVFKLTLSSGGWTEQTLYTFTDWPPNSLVAGNDGNLYGTTSSGGQAGDGTIFQLVPSGGVWTRNILYNFQGTQNDGWEPGNLHQDSFGNLQGTSYYHIDCGDGYGVLFLLSPSNGGWLFSAFGLDIFGPNFTYIDDFTVDAAGKDYFAYSHYSYHDPWGILYDWTRVGGAYWSTTDWFDPTGPMAVDAGHLYGTTPDCGKYSSGTLWSISR